MQYFSVSNTNVESKTVISSWNSKCIVLCSKVGDTVDFFGQQTRTGCKMNKIEVASFIDNFDLPNSSNLRFNEF